MNRNHYVPEGSVNPASLRATQTAWGMKTALLAAIIFAMAGSAFFLGSAKLGQTGGRQSNLRPLATKPSAAAVSLPLYFEPNQGQTDPQVKFLARGVGYGLFFTASEAVLDLQQRATKDQPAAGTIVRMRLEGVSPAASIQGDEPLPGKSSYYIGNDPRAWRRNIPQFGRVAYHGVYPGIDLIYYGQEHQLEYDFSVAPGADPSRIALSFAGASPRLDNGDLVLTTSTGDIRFHAPRVYQPADGSLSVDGKGNDAKQIEVPGTFRLLAANRIGFTVGTYDRSRELIIDPVLTYSTYLGGTNGAVNCPSTNPASPIQGCPQIAVDNSGKIYLAGSTTSTTFPVTSGAYQSTLPGQQNIFVAVLNPSSSQLLYATYLGSGGTDSLGGIAVDSFFNIYVSGTTTLLSNSTTYFPTTSSNAFQTPQSLQSEGLSANGTHGFLTQFLTSSGYGLGYSTYLAGNGTDVVTGLAVDSSENAYLTGTTTSTNGPGNGFPSNSYAYQPCPFAPVGPSGCSVTSGPPQFFASKVATTGAGTGSMLYSTYFGGGNGTIALGGGVAVDSSGYMYFTGTTNMQNFTGTGPPAAFPILNAYQPCLDQPGVTTCTQLANTAPTDAILVKLNPSQAQPGAAPFYSTYLGGSADDVGIAVAVDPLDDGYVTGSTNSSDWNCIANLSCGASPFGYTDTNATNGFIAEISNPEPSVFLTYFAWLGGTTPDGGQTIGQAIAVDSVPMVHVAGQTFSPNLPVSAFPGNTGYPNYLQKYQGAGDAFVALVSPSAVVTDGDYISYLGGTQADQATGIAVDSSNNTYVAGTTSSSPCSSCTPPNIVGFPITPTAYQSTLPGSLPSAFVTELGSSSNIVVSVASGSPNPSPDPAGTTATFTYTITNNGPNPATGIYFTPMPPAGLTVTPTANILTGTGTCGTFTYSGNGNSGAIPCLIPNLAAGGVATVEVLVTPPAPYSSSSISVECTLIANGVTGGSCPSQTDNVVDFTMTSSPNTLTVQNGGLASFIITVAPTNSTLGYTGTISFSETTSPPIVTSTTPTFTNPTVSLSGTGSATTTLNIQTVARPVNTGGLFRRTSFYAAWLPIGGLSLAGLGIGVARRRRRLWFIGALLGLLAALLFLQPACSSSSSSVTTAQGTGAGTYHVYVTGAVSTNASHQIILTLNVT